MRMAIKQGHTRSPGSEQHLGVDVGAQAGTGRLYEGGDVREDVRAEAASGGALENSTDDGTTGSRSRGESSTGASAE
jgi:hypothetical protein